MPALASELRKTLETTVVDARDKAERGARDALTALAVAASEPYSSMNEDERKLRNRLRARGRQLGDQRDPQKGTQSIERLVREMAYEHWHRMLFARFLAENQLLIEPSSGVSISLDECEELAAEEGTDLWGLAAQFAQAMLPQIFRVDDPVLAAKLPLEIRQQLQGLVTGLAKEIFTATDSLGWVYQFWQAMEKDRVNQSETKIGADELPAVTQLFTEPYMVDFLLHNSLGAWWVTRHPDKPCPVELSYLRTLDDGTPAAGKFEGWPDTLKDFTLLDPCCGSGHFLVAAFLLLVPMRMASEGLSARNAIDAVLAENIHGLELDARCVEIAVFALALAAWRFPGENGKQLGVRKDMPTPQVACCGLKLSATSEQWQALVPPNAPDAERLRAGLAQLHRAFSQAPLLGSLLHPARAGEANLLAAGNEQLADFLNQALGRERPISSGIDADQAAEMALTAKGLLEALGMLSEKFDLIATNFPFLGMEKQDPVLRGYIKEARPEGYRELAVAFFLRSRELLSPKGSLAVVMPGEWTFLRPHRHFRAYLLKRSRLRFICKLGWGAFSSGIRAQPVLVISDPNIGPGQSADVAYLELVSDASQDKEKLLLDAHVRQRKQLQWLDGPDARIVDTGMNMAATLEKYAEARTGMSAGDSERFERAYWEIDCLDDCWEFLQSSVSQTADFSGRERIVLWEREQGAMRKLAESVKHLNHAAQNWRRGKPNWGKKGIALSLMGQLPCTSYTGEIYDINCCAIVPRAERDIEPLTAFGLSGELGAAIREFDSSLKVGSPKTILSVEFDIDYWRSRAKEMFPNGIAAPRSDDPTQWVFHGHPRLATDPLQVGVARLVGCRWPAEIDTSMELDDDARTLAVNCAQLAEHADEDGIVCIPAVRGELAAHERLSKLLSSAFGDEWSPAKERELLLAAAVNNNARKSDSSLESWLRNSFFGEHCKMFQSRPFVWQVWDGNPTGFSALVNAHKLAGPNGQGRKTLELLTFTYLGDWIDRQKLDQAEGVNGSDDRLAAALGLQEQLKNILEGAPPYDIFVRWKPLHQQAIGWEPDINDGIRLNIRPFTVAELRSGKSKKGAGVLRTKPGTIKWTKDRGKEPFGSKDDFPWFWGWDENTPAMATDFGAPVAGASPASDSFDGNRWNDLHYTRAAKEAARARHRGEG